MTFSIAILRESYNLWERRAPITPKQVQALLHKHNNNNNNNNNIKVLVQPSLQRVFTDHQYELAGAQITEDIANASLILGVKRPKNEDSILPNTTQAFFSHTIKNQPANRALLQTCLERKVQLIDYEGMIDEKTGKRTVAFGRFAGLAGAVRGLHAIGTRYLRQFHANNPFIGIPPAFCQSSLEQVQDSVFKAGQRLSQDGWPIAPLVMAVPGPNGAVGKGVLEILRLLPHEEVFPDDLPYLPTDSESSHCVYIAPVETPDLVARKDGGMFDRDEYRKHPELYQSTFATDVMPYTDAIFNSVYWDAKYPRLLTKEDLRLAFQHGNDRLKLIVDISCDINGSMECLDRSTTMDHPSYEYSPIDECEVGDESGKKTVTIVGLDILPTELPRESSEHFGRALMPAIDEMIRAQKFENGRSFIDTSMLSGGLANAFVTNIHGKLVRPSSVTVDESKAVKNIVIFGSGMVAKSAISFLGRDGSNRIHVVSNQEKEAAMLARRAKNGCHHALDVFSERKKVSALIKDSDIVVSLLPATMHPLVATECLAHRKNLVTSSYESQEMKELSQSVEAAGLVFLNEVGLDPGIDHMSAMKLIDHVRDRDGNIESFISVCGGLPSPEAADNPLRYKFSWSPKGVISASQNSARYRMRNKVVDVHGDDLLLSAEAYPNAWEELKLECLPNRNSLKYESIYGLESAETIFRGTLRYEGFSRLLYTLRTLGLFESTDMRPYHDWKELMEALCHTRGGFDDVQDLVLASCDDSPFEARRALECLEYLGALSGSEPVEGENLVEAFCALLEKKLQYKAGERDMIVMHHNIIASFPDDSREVYDSSLQLFGDERQSAMAKTVGYTAGLSTNLILSGGLKHRSGLLLPTTRDIYDPVLTGLAQEGVAFEERIRMVNQPRMKTEIL